MGSEMCIRDRQIAQAQGLVGDGHGHIGREDGVEPPGDQSRFCLLYTSDAADELDGVDLGGRRIIKKKKR